jgi:uncharacterized protein (DUF1015 family)
LTYPAVRTLDGFIAEKASGKPEIDFTAGDGVRHMSWTIQDPHQVKFIETQFARIPHLYIADGHHRSAAAARVFESRQGAGQSGRFLAVIFPHDQMQVLPYNRVLKDLNGWPPEQLLEILGTVFAINAAVRPRPRANMNSAFIWPANGTPWLSAIICWRRAMPGKCST